MTPVVIVDTDTDVHWSPTTATITLTSQVLQ